MRACAMLVDENLRKVVVVMAVRLMDSELSEERQANLERYHKDVLWFDAHLEELHAKFPDHWIGVYKEQMAGASPDLDELLVDLKARGYPLNIMFFDFVHSEPQSWVLCEIRC